MNRFWRGFGGRHHWNYGVERTEVPLDVIAKRDNIVVRASMPGIDPKDIQLNIEEGVLTISAETSSEIEAKEESYLLRERRTGSYHRSLRLLDTVDADKADSSYEHGVLTITLPKQEAEKAKRIEVNIK